MMTADLRLGRWQDVLADVPDGSVRLILTSPPYDNARTYEGTCEPVDFGELARFCLRVLTPGGVLAMVLDGAVNDGRQSVTPYRVICDWAAMNGWRFLQVLAYGRAGLPGRFAPRFRKDHEPLILFVKDGALPVAEVSRIAERATWPVSKSGTTRKGDTLSRNTARQDPANIIKNRGSIWWYGVLGAGHDAGSESGHPATFAEAFALDAVTVWSNPGDLVVDPYAGAATSGRACIDLGRRWIGAERVAKYHAIGMQRLAQTSIFGRTA